MIDFNDHLWFHSKSEADLFLKPVVYHPFCVPVFQEKTKQSEQPVLVKNKCKNLNIVMMNCEIM